MAVIRKAHNTRTKKREVTTLIYVFAVTVILLVFGINVAFVQKSAPTEASSSKQQPLVIQPLQPLESLVSSETTIVTAYFLIRSKYPKETYMEWMTVMLSLQDPMVIFTTSDWVEPITSLRQHALNRTLIIETRLEATPMALRGEDFWRHQLDQDPEKKRHAGYQVFWIWLSKTYFVLQAIEQNPYASEIFMWSDIGCFRGKQAGKYRDKVLMQHIDVIPKDRILFLAHQQEIIPPPQKYWNSKLKEKEHFYHSGSQMIGYKDIFRDYHDAFLKTVEGFLERKMFIGDDQPVFQSTCLLYPHLCAYVQRKQVKDNHYFGLRFVVFTGGKFDYWYPSVDDNGEEANNNEG